MKSVKLSRLLLGVSLFLSVNTTAFAAEVMKCGGACCGAPVAKKAKPLVSKSDSEKSDAKKIVKVDEKKKEYKRGSIATH